MTELSQLSQQQNNTWFGASQPTWIQNGVVPEWFYWRISRKAAEDLLVSKPPGSFLIRVSESRVGYTLSYRAEGRFRHFMIDAKEDGSCTIVGERKCHSSLQQLVDFHRKVPIAAHNEVLTFSCGRASNVWKKYSGNSSVQSSTSHVTSKENQEYHNNDESRNHARPAMPVPKTRKRYITDNTMPVKPLETPSKNVLTPPNKEVTPAPIVDHHNETNTKTEELQEMSWEQLFDAVLSPYDDDEGENLPQEYSPPPPFAPGYQTKEA
ncbi:hematopoietic SH2 domain-containing protein homolog [Hippocampus comes]|uniref:hematopoietic SH2 domain-containing protein homolog n=1 Tax=Hippocampus comes TaxID=109280 RepID=UPI00094E95EE|nr:PREDICTED: hematopoietic SH2 domain-containing protein homolog [Hippocampus comes]